MPVLLLMLTHTSQSPCGRGPQMTALYADGRDDPRAGSQAGGHHRRRGRTRRPRMVLLDYPDSEGVTRELAVGQRGRRITGKRLPALRPVLALGASAILGLAAILVSQTAFRSAGTGPAPDIHLPVVPFPTASASPTAQASARPLAGSTAAALHRQPERQPVHAQRRGSAEHRQRHRRGNSPPSSRRRPLPARSRRSPSRTLVVAQADGGFRVRGRGPRRQQRVRRRSRTGR